MITVLALLILKAGTVSAMGTVTFENPDICALKGTSVEFRCSYSYPDDETVQKAAWFKGQSQYGIWKRVKLSELPSYENRTEYVGDKQHDCSLAIHDLQDGDTGHYYFRFDTENFGWRSKTSVHLTVTEPNATVYADTVRARDKVTLECRTSCQLSNIVWFKDGRPVAQPEFEAKAEDSGKYVCAFEGHESALSDPVFLDVQYPPMNVSIEVTYLDEPTVGRSVIMTCQNTANPAADNYTWYRASASSLSSMSQVDSGQMVLNRSVNAADTELYICQARNKLGESNSTEVLLIPLSEEGTVDNTDRAQG
ncbi:B-cell receptor CD22-like, partial [Plectropomus leopardus]